MIIFLLAHIITASLIIGKMFELGNYSWLQAFTPSLIVLAVWVFCTVALYTIRKFD